MSTNPQAPPPGHCLSLLAPLSPSASAPPAASHCTLRALLLALHEVLNCLSVGERGSATRLLQIWVPIHLGFLLPSEKMRMDIKYRLLIDNKGEYSNKRNYICIHFHD